MTAERLFVAWAFVFQAALIVHFALRKWFFAAYVQPWGWLFYALSLPAVAISLVILAAKRPWPLWLGGFLFLAWAALGVTVEYVVKNTSWRQPIQWPIFGPYVLLYLATVMFYWFPVANVSRPSWYLLAIMFLISTALNLSSH